MDSHKTSKQVWVSLIVIFFFAVVRCKQRIAGKVVAKAFETVNASIDAYIADECICILENVSTYTNKSC